MVVIVIVSHSWKISEGICDLAAHVAGTAARIISAGGMQDGEIGTDAVKISEAIRAADSGDGVVVLADIGSSIMSAETAFELLADEDIDARLADAPIVEGAIAASVEAVCGGGIDEVVKAAEDARLLRKTN